MSVLFSWLCKFAPYCMLGPPQKEDGSSHRAYPVNKLLKFKKRNVVCPFLLTSNWSSFYIKSSFILLHTRHPNSFVFIILYIMLLSYYIILRIAHMSCHPTLSSTRHCSSVAGFKGRFSPLRYILAKSRGIITQQKFPEYSSLALIRHYRCGSVLVALCLYSNCELDTWMHL